MKNEKCFLLEKPDFETSKIYTSKLKLMSYGFYQFHDEKWTGITR